MSAHTDLRVEKLLKEVFSARETLEPSFDLKQGYHYPEVEEVLECTSEESKRFLDSLVDEGVLSRDLYLVDIACPKCMGHNVATVYVCPSCGSMNLIKDNLVEHTRCGYIDLISRFNRTEGGFKCPNCGNIVPLSEIRVIGGWYRCVQCNKSISTPKVTHFCRYCKKSFTLDEAVQVKIYRYRVHERTLKRMTDRHRLIRSIYDYLTDIGLSVEIEGKIKGPSGVEHPFNLLIRDSKGDRWTVDVIVSESPVSHVELIPLYAKMFDVRGLINKPILVVVPSLESAQLRLLKVYNIEVIEGQSVDDALAKVKEVLSKLLGQEHS